MGEREGEPTDHAYTYGFWLTATCAGVPGLVRSIKKEVSAWSTVGKWVLGPRRHLHADSKKTFWGGS